MRLIPMIFFSLYSPRLRALCTTPNRQRAEESEAFENCRKISRGKKTRWNRFLLDFTLENCTQFLKKMFVFLSFYLGVHTKRKRAYSSARRIQFVRVQKLL